MGYAVIMFVALMIMSVVMITAVTYGIAKDSQVAPLKAENAYADIKTKQAQTGLTIVNTCLNGSGEYTNPDPGVNPGLQNLYLTVLNNGSIVLNSTKATVLYNASYINFTVTSAGNVWTPLTNASLMVSNIYLDPGLSPGSLGPKLRLLVSAENGVSAIAPTTPTNFSVINIANKTDVFYWNSSEDQMGISQYIIYNFLSNNAPSQCPWPTPDNIIVVSGNQTNLTAQVPCPQPCNKRYFFMTALDFGGNMAIQSRYVRCNGQSPGPCQNY